MYMLEFKAARHVLGSCRGYLRCRGTHGCLAGYLCAARGVPQAPWPSSDFYVPTHRGSCSTNFKSLISVHVIGAGLGMGSRPLDVSGTCPPKLSPLLLSLVRSQRPCRGSFDIHGSHFFTSTYLAQCRAKRSSLAWSNVAINLDASLLAIPGHPSIASTAETPSYLPRHPIQTVE